MCFSEHAERSGDQQMPAFGLGAARLLIDQDAVGDNCEGKRNSRAFTGIEKQECQVGGRVRPYLAPTLAAAPSRPGQLQVCLCPAVLLRPLGAPTRDCREAAIRPRLRSPPGNGGDPYRLRRSFATFGPAEFLAVPDGGEVVLKI